MGGLVSLVRRRRARDRVHEQATKRARADEDVHVGSTSRPSAAKRRRRWEPQRSVDALRWSTLLSDGAHMSGPLRSRLMDDVPLAHTDHKLQALTRHGVVRIHLEDDFYIVGQPSALVRSMIGRNGDAVAAIWLAEEARRMADRAIPSVERPEAVLQLFEFARSQHAISVTTGAFEKVLAGSVRVSVDRWRFALDVDVRVFVNVSDDADAYPMGDVITKATCLHPRLARPARDVCGIDMCRWLPSVAIMSASKCDPRTHMITEWHAVHKSVAAGIMRLVGDLVKDAPECARVRAVDDVLRLETHQQRHRRWVHHTGAPRPKAAEADASRLPTPRFVQWQMGYACGAHSSFSPGNATGLALPADVIARVIRPMWLRVEKRAAFERLAARVERDVPDAAATIRNLSL